MNRRSLLLGLAAGVFAPSIIRTPGLLMPITPIWEMRPMPEGWMPEIKQEVDWETGHTVRKLHVRVAFGVDHSTFGLGYVSDGPGQVWADVRAEVSIPRLDQHLRESMWRAIEIRRVQNRKDWTPQPIWPSDPKEALIARNRLEIDSEGCVTPASECYYA